MDVLNLIFGLISVISFGYAIWANRTLSTAQTQRDRAIASIRDIADRLHQQSPNTASGVAAYSIIRICNALVPLGGTSGQLVGRLRLAFHPWEQPPMHTHGGTVVEDSRARLGKALESSRIGERPRHYAVFGPYQPLPLLGRYRVEFSLRRVSAAEVNANTALVRIDVYAYTDGKTILARISHHG